MNKILVN